MRDVARRAGVSQATVSLVLNAVAGVRISEETRRRVIDAADKLNYRRSPRIRAESRAASVIGLVIDDVASSPFAAPLLDGAREAAWEHDGVVTVVTTRNHGPIEEAAMRAMLSLPVEGIVYATLFTREVTPPPLVGGLPLVLLNCYDADNAYASVVPDDFAGAAALTNALLAAGHRRIGHIAGEAWLDAGRARLAGYRDALTKRGIDFDDTLIQNLGSAVSAGRNGAHALLDLHEPPTAIFCFNDRLAIGAIGAATERGLSVPEDLSVVGFDNDPFASAVFPDGLTTALLPHEDMARWAVHRLMDLRHGRKAGLVEQIRLGCPIVRANSIAAPRA